VVAMKRPASEMASALPPVPGDALTLGDAARRARVESGSNAALELAIDSDDDGWDLGSDWENDGLADGDGVVGGVVGGNGGLAGVAAGAPDCTAGAAQETTNATAAAASTKQTDDSNIPQEALIRRRLGRMRELNSLYEDQYWRLLEDLRRCHYRFALRHGHGGRKDDVLVETLAREKTGAAQLSQCVAIGCDERPMPLTTFCFQHILQDPKQTLYAPASADGKETTGGEPIEPVLRTESTPAAAVPAIGTATAATTEAK
jgi:hypothetical protein